MTNKEVVQRLLPRATCSRFQMCQQWHVAGLSFDGKHSAVLSAGFDTEEEAWNDVARVLNILVFGTEKERKGEIVMCNAFRKDLQA